MQKIGQNAKRVANRHGSPKMLSLHNVLQFLSDQKFIPQ